MNNIPPNIQTVTSLNRRLCPDHGIKKKPHVEKCATGKKILTTQVTDLPPPRRFYENYKLFCQVQGPPWIPDNGTVINLPKTNHLIKYLKEGFNAKCLYDHDAPLTVDGYIYVPDEHTREYIQSRTMTYNKEEIQVAKNLSMNHEKAWYLSPSEKGKSIRAIMDFLKEKPDLFCSKILTDMQMTWMQMRQEVPEWQT